MVRYQSATRADYDEILALNEAAIPAVNRISEVELTQLAGQAAAFIVARKDAQVAGFLLALNETARYQSLNFQYFLKHYDRFAYVDRIVVGADCRRLGIGVGLYQSLFSSTRGIPRVTCEVNVVPPNPESLAFHRSLGFEVVGEQDTEAGSKRVALMVRSASSDPFIGSP